MKIVLIGAGNLSTNLGKALLDAGNDILQVYSRTFESASALANFVGGAPVTNIDSVTKEADVYVISVKDSAIAEIVPVLCKGRGEKVFLHTSGSVSLDVFKGMALHYGVLYPMQTFSKSKLLNFKNIPFFVEGNDDYSFETVHHLADSISENVHILSSEARKHLHLAAVFACNFVNHCYEISSEILAKHNIPFDVMLPLIDETANKVHQMKPDEAQTGPAVRYDQNIIRMQSDLLRENPIFKQIYECMSLSIHYVTQKKGGNE
ncbi:Rossmann-like and DUF2520 domain-containing protein [uncultured Prevotella sp.]|uniref:Rossmann-like and DUF2520 domain-containing protein n=1 Tax=uncultured Prevotella sp. TaxID=159272 RepID=UPI00260AECAC|nr:Rossmann-like and DUF2520 domain-containing protein [uncultured Prevotella sp.]